MRPLEQTDGNWPYDRHLRERIAANLASFPRRNNDCQGAKRAAVALVVTNGSDEPPLYGMAAPPADQAVVVLTKRSPRLQNHAGQWALPGGRLEEGEDVGQTALRELEEEVALRLDDRAILGRLDDYTTRSGFTISPVVIWGGKDLQLKANPREVASIHRISLAEFMRPDAPILEEVPESSEPVLFMPVGRGWIASPTGAILYQFREVALNGRPVRVAHFEQPRFAWQ